MKFTLTTQFLTMLTMIAMGNWLGAALDTYRRFLQKRKPNSWLMIINDTIFWVFQALLLFYVLYLVNEGEIHFYIFLALLLGFSMYQSLFKNIYLFILNQLIRLCKKIYSFIVKILTVLFFKPILWLVNIVVTFLLVIGKLILQLLEWILKPLMWLFGLLGKQISRSVKMGAKKISHIFIKIFRKIFRKKK